MTGPTFEDTQKTLDLLSKQEYQYWVNESVLTLQWLLLVGLLILPWLIWWKLVDRRRLFETITLGYIVFFITLILDELGTELLMWGYRYRVTPLLHALIPYDFTVLPVIYMLFYQWFKTWKLYFWAHVGLAFVFAFVSEPILKWLNIYETYHWKSIYSFPVYILIALFVRWLTLKLLEKQKAANG
jgi:hypothetical protein